MSLASHQLFETSLSYKIEFRLEKPTHCLKGFTASINNQLGLQYSWVPIWEIETELLEFW